MAKDSLFIEDDDENKERDGEETSKAGRPVFDPFAGESVSIGDQPVTPSPAAANIAASSSGDLFTPGGGDVSAPVQPVTASGKPSTVPTSSPDPFADAAVDPGAADVGPDDAEADIRPGQGKDLWLCPHCSAKNKPARSTCRSCGKSPDEPVIVPLTRRPYFYLAVLAIIFLLAWLLFGGGPSFEHKPASYNSLDRYLRIDGGASGAVPLAGQEMIIEGRIAGVGRILQISRRELSGTSVASALVLFGARGRVSDDTFFSELRPKEMKTDVDVFWNQKPVPLDDLDFALLHFIETPAIEAAKRGDLLSFTGTHGRIEDWGNLDLGRKREYVVMATEMDVVSP